MDDTLFDQVAEATRSLVPPELGALRLRSRRWAVKAWFGPTIPTKEHYEAQLLGAAHVPGTAVVGIEIGFHAEHKDPADNDRCLARLDARGKGWRRVSEVWVDPDLGDDELAWEIAIRLTDYILCIEPLRTA